jgi:hypothetical protein
LGEVRSDFHTPLATLFRLDAGSPRNIHAACFGLASRNPVHSRIKTHASPPFRVSSARRALTSRSGSLTRLAAMPFHHHMHRQRILFQRVKSSLTFRRTPFTHQTSPFLICRSDNMQKGPMNPSFNAAMNFSVCSVMYLSQLLRPLLRHASFPSSDVRPVNAEHLSNAVVGAEHL